ncbi:hypothetical protein KJ987_05235, partial [bacterium]|nr:hypothetical protein [bacterium]
MNKPGEKNSKFLEYFFNISSLGTIGIFLVLIILLTFFTAERNFMQPDNIRNLLFFGSEFI